MPRSEKTLSQRSLSHLKFKIEQAKLSKLEADLPSVEPEYIRYVDLPPLHPEDKIDLCNRFTHLARRTEGESVAAEIEDAVNHWHAMNNGMRGQPIGTAQDKRETIPFWEGLTENGYSLFEGGVLCEDFIAAIFKGKEAQSEAVQAYHEANIVDVVIKGKRP
ncbi:hypothetical protein DES40_1054 [Litorimonas taeanensis]|uniref:Uncharacterized protein n=1 Tax=Litorimonas taeanensis TaxID=568099 RepID=A0A420WLE2_9PROT|nr:hypothetical protein [Litorimonas taeanensis]RKQ71726.1 hypothetical protein DES40_1054 [Litorimonas taeanensis]